MKSQSKIQMNNQPTIKITNATTGQPDQVTISNEKSKSQQNTKKKFYIVNRQRSEKMEPKIPTGR
jgi:hypothetical protein